MVVVVIAQQLPKLVPVKVTMNISNVAGSGMRLPSMANVLVSMVVLFTVRI